MHGRIKVRTSEEEKRKKELERQTKLKQFRAAMSKIQTKREKEELDKEMLELTSALLYANPDIYTLWNIRREVILEVIKLSENPTLDLDQNCEVDASLQSGDVDSILKDSKSFQDQTIDLTSLFDAELYLTECCLKANPKSYCAWHHREWILTTRKDPNWKEELRVCNLYLNYDSRNFHTWDYRRFVVSKYNLSLEEEFKFTTEKIMENFSNYSAWHHRSKLLLHLYPDKEGMFLVLTTGGRPIEDIYHKEELKMIVSAAFTDPDDTSAWFYQRWLLGAVRYQPKVMYCSLTSSECLVVLNMSIEIKDANKIIAEENGEVLNWKFLPVNKDYMDMCWKAYLGDEFTKTEQSDMKVCFQTEENKNDWLQLLRENENLSVGSRKIDFKKTYSHNVVEELESQLHSCEQLMELEPDNRWTLLAMTLILHSLNPIENHEKVINNLNTLSKLDKQRTGYYKDLISKWTIENFLQDRIMGPNAPSMKEKYSTQLTSLYHMQYWSVCKEVDFSHQALTSRSLPALQYLVMCEKLDLSYNEITTVNNFPKLPKLNEIILKSNKINKEEASEQFSFASVVVYY